jgi:hypothetical protein
MIEASQTDHQMDRENVRDDYPSGVSIRVLCSKVEDTGTTPATLDGIFFLALDRAAFFVSISTYLLSSFYCSMD